jgi:YaiO family outer membrane protein
MRKHLFVFILLLINTTSFAQSSDDFFKQARELGFSGKRKEARALCYKALEKSPDYSDIRIFLGRLYSWDDQYDSARICFKEVIRRDPKNMEAYSALCDNELWSDHPLDAIKYAGEALHIDSLNTELRLKKAKGLANSGNPRDAYTEVKRILEIDPANSKAFEYAESLKQIMRVNKLSLSYDRDEFDKSFSPWNSAAISYTRRTKYLGPVTGRVTFADRFETQGLQYEVDMYPSLFKKTYAYINFGLSDANIFPEYRFGASVFHSLPSAFEAEIGIRYLQFDKTTLSYTGSLGKYISSFWFSFRPSFTPNRTGTSFSWALTSRYYLSNPDNFFTLIFGTGIGPDELKIERDSLGANAVLLNSQKVRIGFQHLISKSLIISIGTVYIREETTYSGYRTNYNFNIAIEKSF